MCIPNQEPYVIDNIPSANRVVSNGMMPSPDCKSKKQKKRDAPSDSVRGTKSILYPSAQKKTAQATSTKDCNVFMMKKEKSDPSKQPNSLKINKQATAQAGKLAAATPI